MDELLDLLEQGEYVGICQSCHEIAYGVEPDAYGYECESCGAMGVVGAERALMGY